MSDHNTQTLAVLANIQEIAVQAIATASGDDFDALPAAELQHEVAVEIRNQLRDLAGV